MSRLRKFYETLKFMYAMSKRARSANNESRDYYVLYQATKA